MSSLPITRKQQTGEPTNNGGHFGGRRRADDTVDLQPAIKSTDVESWLSINSLYLSTPGVTEMTARLNAGGSDSTPRRVDVFRAVHKDTFGFSHEDATALSDIAENLRGSGDERSSEALYSVLRAAQKNVDPAFTPSAVPPAPVGDGTRENPVSALDPAVQRGVVFDNVVTEDGTVFSRSRDGVYPDWPYAVRIQANRPLTDEEVEHLGSSTAYALGATVRGETLSGGERDSPYSFILSHDSTKGNGEGFDKFESQLPEIVADGSLLRTTDRSGAGTAGTRAVQALPDAEGLVFEIYYDSVV
jgi:hypothetical protein